MKKTIILGLLIIGFNNCIAQKVGTIKELGTDVNLKDYDVKIVNPYGDKFVGKWYWKQGDKRLQIDIKKTNLKGRPFGKILESEVFDGSYKYFIAGKAIALPDTNLMSNGQITSHNEPLVFNSSRKGINTFFYTIYTIEVHFVDPNTIQLKYRASASQEDKKYIPFPLDITLKRM